MKKTFSIGFERILKKKNGEKRKKGKERKFIAKFECPDERNSKEKEVVANVTLVLVVDATTTMEEREREREEREGM